MHSRLVSVLAGLALGAAFSGYAASAEAAVRAGSKCSKSGAIAGQFVCANKGGKLVWQALRKQSITVATPESMPLAARSFLVLPIASSLLQVSVSTRSPEVCALAGREVQLLATGACLLEFGQAGNRTYAAASASRTIRVMGDNRITAPSVTSAKLADRSITVSPTASSELPVLGTSTTSAVCSVDSRGAITLLTPGTCTISWTQPGDDFHLAAAPTSTSFPVIADNAIAFKGPQQLPLGAVFTLLATATSGQPVLLRSTTPTICIVSGNTLQALSAGSCTVVAEQASVGFYAAASPVSVTMAILGARSTVDLPDSSSGYLLHFVYVVPSDGVDRQYDTDGSIKAWIDEGQAFLRAQIGMTLPIDSTAQGYDIQFLRSSSTAAQLATYVNTRSCAGPDGTISAELGVSCISQWGANYNNMKHYVYLIDVPSIAGKYCGYAGMPGNVSVVAIGTEWRCTGAGGGFSTWRVKTWLHEVFHGFGIDHAPSGSCDLMEPGGSCTQTYVDRNRQFYINSSTLGVDIMRLSLWRRE